MTTTSVPRQRKEKIFSGTGTAVRGEFQFLKKITAILLSRLNAYIYPLFPGFLGEALGIDFSRFSCRTNSVLASTGQSAAQYISDREL